jgi:UDP-N-acetylglucosamine 2-epimerase (non-hydrolysing)
MQNVLLIFGTRPEAIKLCPLVLALRQRGVVVPRVCVTGQHQRMLAQVLDVFGVVPDVDLALMQPNQALPALTARAISAIAGYLTETKPNLVVVQGDTTTAFCAALTAYYERIAVAHVEAGLRTWNRFAPFPEEMNRVLTARLADYHFAPTRWAADNLAREGVPAEQIMITGNTVIDALQYAAPKATPDTLSATGLPPDLLVEKPRRRLVLVTGHRRENFGAGFERICLAIATLSTRFPDVAWVYPVHLNPNVREPVFRLLGGRANVHLIEPLNYLPFVALLKLCTLALTDSGGVQEEAPSLGKPVLVMRDTTERPEAVEAGTAALVGTDVQRIVTAVTTLLTDPEAYAQMAQAINPYGDGLACQRIADVIEGRLYDSRP